MPEPVLALTATIRSLVSFPRRAVSQSVRSQQEDAGEDVRSDEPRRHGGDEDAGVAESVRGHSQRACSLHPAHSAATGS